MRVDQVKLLLRQQLVTEADLSTITFWRIDWSKNKLLPSIFIIYIFAILRSRVECSSVYVKVFVRAWIVVLARVAFIFLFVFVINNNWSGSKRPHSNRV